MYTRRIFLLQRAALLLLAVIQVPAFTAEADWQILINGGEGLDNFQQIGDANWTATDGAIQATEGGAASFLVTREDYTDLVLRVEFWASEDANSGIFLRCQDPANINDRNCYEANIYDQRPDPTFATGGIVHIGALTEPRPLAGGKWNSYEITLQGTSLKVVLNGQTTVDIEDSQFASGRIALQWGRGIIRFRKFELLPL